MILKKNMKISKIFSFSLIKKKQIYLKKTNFPVTDCKDTKKNIFINGMPKSKLMVEISSNGTTLIEQMVAFYEIVKYYKLF